MTAAERLSRWAADLSFDAVPLDVRAAAALHLLDGVGCALAGSREVASRAAVAVAGLTPSPQEATVIGHDLRLPAPAAALANGALVHALDFDDTHAPGLVHATAAVLPAAFAVGEEVAASGAEILTAAVAGYEAACHLAAAVPHGYHEQGFHATSVCGTFSSALVAAWLYGLAPDAIVHALGIAGSAAAGSLEFLSSPATTKQLHPGLAAQAGITAARLAREGATGPATIFEGEHGLFRSYTRGAPGPELFGPELGGPWETEAIDIKPFPACQLSHGALHAAARAHGELASRGGASAVDAVLVRLPEESVPIVAEPANAKRRPGTSYEAKFSLQWSVAAMLVDGSVTPTTFAPAQLSRPEVLAIADRVEVEPFKADGPAADVPGRLVIELRSGSPLVIESPAHGAGGRQATIDKFLANGGGAARAEHLLAIADLGPAELGPILAAPAEAST